MMMLLLLLLLLLLFIGVVIVVVIVVVFVVDWFSFYPMINMTTINRRKKNTKNNQHPNMLS